MKNNWTNPNISRRPNNMSNVFTNRLNTGSPE